MPLNHNYYLNLLFEQSASSTVCSTLTDSLSACVKITVHCMLSNMQAGEALRSAAFFGGVAQLVSV